MVVRRRRVRVVLDTNVLIRNFKSRSPHSPNKRVFRLWRLERRLQLIVSDELIKEYLETLEEVVRLGKHALTKWRSRFERDSICTLVRLGRRYTESRDPDDNILLATASAGNADYLIMNDLDLLELPESVQRTFPFRILTPQACLQEMGEQ